MSLLNFPLEIIELIADHLYEKRYLNSLVQACKQLHPMLNWTLCRNNSRSWNSLALVWAAKHNYESTARKALDVASTQYCHLRLRQLLALAVRQGHESIVCLLLELCRGRKIFSSQNGCESCKSCIIGDKSTYQKLLQLAFIRENADTMETPLSCSLAPSLLGNGYLDIVNCATERGNVNILKARVEAGVTFGNDVVSGEKVICTAAYGEILMWFDTL